MTQIGDMFRLKLEHSSRARDETQPIICPQTRQQKYVFNTDRPSREASSNEQKN